MVFLSIPCALNSAERRLGPDPEVGPVEFVPSVVVVARGVDGPVLETLVVACLVQVCPSMFVCSEGGEIMRNTELDGLTDD